MKISKLLTALLFFFLVIAYLACKKTDITAKKEVFQSTKFFALPADASSPLKRVAKVIQRQDATHPFIETFMKKEGMPIWDKSAVYLSSNNNSTRNGGFSTDTIVLVPVAKESDSIVKCFLACNVNTDTVLIRLIRDWEYKNYSFENREDTMTANALALQLMSFQKKVFGDSMFYIRDSRLFNYKKTSGEVIKPKRITIRSSSKSARQFNNAMFISWYECFPVIYDGNEGQLVGVAPGETADYPGEIGTVCYYNSIWIDDGGGGTTGGDPTGGTGGSGGGGSWYDGGGDPCSGSTTPIPRLSRLAPPDGCDPGWEPVNDNPPLPPNDPCADAKSSSDAATNLSKDNNFVTARKGIQTAASDNKEHSITFGKDASGNITISSMDNGSSTAGSINTSWPGAFADIHNHINAVAPSPGDFYGLVSLNSNHSDWKTRFVVTSDGSVYALAVIDFPKASAFVRLHPADQVPGYPPTFPDTIGDDLAEAKSYIKNIMGISSLIADEMAMAFVLEKYDTGVALLKQDSNGNFKRLLTNQTVSNGNTIYKANNCQ